MPWDLTALLLGLTIKITMLILRTVGVSLMMGRVMFRIIETKNTKNRICSLRPNLALREEGNLAVFLVSMDPMPRLWEKRVLSLAVLSPISQTGGLMVGLKKEMLMEITFLREKN